jgi:hypothetical protein
MKTIKNYFPIIENIGRPVIDILSSIAMKIPDLSLVFV